MSERRYAALEVRGEEDAIRGVLLPYGGVARIGRVQERFVSGAFGAGVADADIVMNLEHDPGRPVLRTGGGGLRLQDSATALRVEMDGGPENTVWREVRGLIRSGVLRGLSVEFAVEPRGDDIRSDESGLHRTIRRARLLGAAIVAKPAYPAAQVRSLEAAMEERGLRWREAEGVRRPFSEVVLL